MYNKKPPFEITNTILKEMANIAELVGKISVKENLNSSPVLRRHNRIRTIYSSLAIEQNTLSLEQVTAVLSGKHVIAPPKDIAEVKNAYEIYDAMGSLNPFSVEDFLSAHAIMTRGLVDESGCFRTKPVGVVDSQGNILHFGTLPDYIPGLVNELFDWVKNSDLPMLLKSCVFHYELELIHPFADGNGRMGRLWHTLLLSQWNPVFAWLPVESIIHDRQQEYYESINKSNVNAESSVFITFMLSAINDALAEAIQIEQLANNMSTDEIRWQQINQYLLEHDVITNANVRELLQVSPATANRILARFTERGLICKIRLGKQWAYCYA